LANEYYSMKLYLPIHNAQEEDLRKHHMSDRSNLMVIRFAVQIIGKNLNSNLNHVNKKVRFKYAVQRVCRRGA
jgi:hypothetical protein